MSYQIGLDGRREKKGKKERMGPERKEKLEQREKARAAQVKQRQAG